MTTHRWIRRHWTRFVTILLVLGFHPVSQSLADVLAEGETQAPANSDTRKWERCVERHSRDYDRITVVCPDGFVLRQR